ncbi:hypothetical protein JB92DRAFT_3117889 [Gautieria morchelliformis]|nr:hypothetical protein JB92DRAFT_3117889 [Gautieria morchelliformis]
MALPWAYKASWCEVTGSFPLFVPHGLYRTSVKVRLDFQGELREEVGQWVVEAEGIQAKLRSAMRVEAIIDPAFKRTSDVDDLVKEVKEAKEWLGSLDFIVNLEFFDVGMKPVPDPTPSRCPSKEPEVVGQVAKEPEVGGNTVRESENSTPVVEPIAVSPKSPQPSASVQPVRTKRRPMFLSSDDKGKDALTPKKAQKELGPQQPVLEPARSPSVDIVAIKLTPAQRCKGRAMAQVTESDKVPQSVVKQGYPDHPYLLGRSEKVGEVGEKACELLGEFRAANDRMNRADVEFMRIRRRRNYFKRMQGARDLAEYGGHRGLVERSSSSNEEESDKDSEESEEEDARMLE